MLPRQRAHYGDSRFIYEIKCLILKCKCKCLNVLKTSLVFLRDDVGLRTVISNRRLLRQS